ncbi:STAS domain-containing protein [Micromonospora psammae]|uniref:STAS domain-containing protein n=1 Tax=Micromonospora sp. CPCC 205556 TaxID=3122398 RepID=UPI002FEE7FFB
MTLSWTREGRVTVVGVRGEIDMGSAPLLVDLAPRLGDEGAPLVVLDLSRVDFVDLHGLTALTEAQALVRRGGGRLVLRQLPPCLTRLLQLTGCTLPAAEPAAGNTAEPAAGDAAGPSAGAVDRSPASVHRHSAVGGGPVDPTPVTPRSGRRTDAGRPDGARRPSAALAADPS